MRLGAFLPPWGPAATPADFDRVADAVEAAGFDSLWTGDHVVFPDRVVSRYPYNASGRSPFDPDLPLFEPLTLLAYLAARTSRVRLGISVLVLPLRTPVLAGRMLDNLDRLSRGRLVLGVGVGWMREEFELLGADFERRGPASDAALSVIRAMCGRPLPVLVGGHSGPALRRAARLGDGWHGIRLSPGAVRAARERLQAMLAAAGRDRAGFEIVIRAPLPPAEAAETMAAYAAAGVDELIVEVPEAGTEERIAALRSLRKLTSKRSRPR